MNRIVLRRIQALQIDLVIVSMAYFQMIKWILPSIDVVLLFVYWTIAILVYFAAMESSSLQSSLGKMMRGMIVENKSGTRLTFLLSLYRVLVAATSFVCVIGMLAPFLRQDEQFIQDIVCKTHVKLKSSNK